MSLKLTNKVTDKQIAMLKQLEYYGTLILTIAEAQSIIDSLLEQERHRANRPEQKYYDRVKLING